MLYLAEKNFKTLRAERSKRQKSCYAMVNVSDGGIDPCRGKLSFSNVIFQKMCPPHVPVIKMRRGVYEVLNNRLKKVEFLAGEISIDIATWVWVYV